tara:strand:+ start:955 stop:1164 length:210 start_codon:yes stop_codon:yes gene_type:complete
MTKGTAIEVLIKRALEITNKQSNEIERSTWMAVHEYIHGVLPVEYDIREIDEELYLEVLAKVKEAINSR